MLGLEAIKKPQLLPQEDVYNILVPCGLFVQRTALALSQPIKKFVLSKYWAYKQLRMQNYHVKRMFKRIPGIIFVQHISMEAFTNNKKLPFI